MADTMVITVHRDGALLHRFDVPQAAQQSIIDAFQAHRKIHEYPKVIWAADGRELGTARTRGEEDRLLKSYAENQINAS